METKQETLENLLNRPLLFRGTKKTIIEIDAILRAEGISGLAIALWYRANYGKGTADEN